MAVPIEGYSVVAQRARIKHLLADKTIEIMNATALGDEDIWRCCFMAEADAEKFMVSLEKLGLNVSQGPDSDVVLVNEFNHSIYPYCEWLVTGKLEKAVIAWKAGTHPKTIVARDGWDPKFGSGLVFHDPKTMKNLEFLRLEENVEVFLNKETGEEVFIGRTSTPVDSIFQSASRTISQHFVTAGEDPLTGEDAEAVAGAVEMLKKVIEETPEWWNALWFHGKGQLALGNHELAYRSFRRAYEQEKGVEAIPREFAGVCLELHRFDEAVKIAEQSVELAPDNVELIGNLSIAYLLAGQIKEAKKSISAAIKMNKDDKINNDLSRIISEVVDGKRPLPMSLEDLSKPVKPKKRPFWKFW